MAARIYEPYDSEFADRCHQVAEAGYRFLLDHPDAIDPNDDEWLQRHYNSPDGDERLWAAAEMWESFGSAEALADFESRAADVAVRTNWDWPDVQNLGLFTYVLSQREERDPAVLAHVETALTDAADSIVSAAESQAYGVGYTGRPYWGINGVIVRMAMTLHVVYRLHNDAKYLDAAIQQLDYVLGRNLYGRSFVTALGVAPPMSPHHRPSVADSIPAPWPGLLVGGPNGEGPDPESDEDNDWRAWVDRGSDFQTNEVAINWNAALVYALAAPYDG
jgi:endoglucanase